MGYISCPHCGSQSSWSFVPQYGDGEAQYFELQLWLCEVCRNAIEIMFEK